MSNQKDELLQPNEKIFVSKTFSGIVERSEGTRSVTPGISKDYFEFCELLKTALDDYQVRLESPKKVLLSWEDPDNVVETEVITIKLKNREPGAFDQGAPLAGSVKNYKPILREKKDDPNAPGYKKAIFGRYHDNVLVFTCWAQTNKEAIMRSLWFESFMEKYNWFFKLSGVQRVLFLKQEEDIIVNNQGKKLYGRPLFYFVRTEELTEISEKEMEQIYINLAVKKK